MEKNLREKFEEFDKILRNQGLKHKEYEKFKNCEKLFKSSEPSINDEKQRQFNIFFGFGIGRPLLGEFRRFEREKMAEFEQFLTKFSFPQLQLICIMSNMYINDEDDIKSKLILKIIYSPLTINKINKIISKSKNYAFVIECNDDQILCSDSKSSYFSNLTSVKVSYEYEDFGYGIFDMRPSFELEKCALCNRECGCMVVSNLFYEKNMELICISGEIIKNNDDKMNPVSRKNNVRKRPIPPKLREKIWLEYIGNKISCLCPICEEATISSFSFECGHVIAEINDGSMEIQNLRAICGSCNKSMGSKHMKNYVEEFYPNAPILSTFS